MYVQIVSMQCPMGQIKQLRELLADEYLPALTKRPGFINAHLLEQVDDRDFAKLIIYWDSQGAYEETVRTGVLTDSPSSIAARMPGLRVQRDSYIVKVTTNDNALSR
jgi:heme-degrading monooxygenase HmoA